MTGQKRPLAKLVEKQYSHDSEWLNSIIRVSISISKLVEKQYSHDSYEWLNSILSRFDFQYRCWHRRVIRISGIGNIWIIGPDLHSSSQEGEGVILVTDIVLVTAEQRCKKWQIWQMYLCYSFQSGANFVVQCTDMNRNYEQWTLCCQVCAINAVVIAHIW